MDKLELILNELSLKNYAPNLLKARELMSNLIETIISVKGVCGTQVTLRSQYDFLDTILADNYPLRQWLNDRNVDKIERLFIKNLVRKSPFSAEVAHPEIQAIEDNIGDIEFRYRGESAIGLGVAYLLNTLSISLLSSSNWNNPYIEIEITHLDLEDEIGIVRHISEKNHVREHSHWSTNKIRQNIQDGVDLWQSKAELFPHLEFCLNVERQLEQMVATNPIFQQILKRLSELEEAAHNWTEGSFNLDSLPSKVTPESESRLKDFSQKLTFMCPDGVSRLFSLHSRVTPGAGRVYFSLELGPGKIIIGYIGQKIM
jgi:hypothetical protein